MMMLFHTLMCHRSKTGSCGRAMRSMYKEILLMKDDNPRLIGGLKELITVNILPFIPINIDLLT